MAILSLRMAQPRQRAQILRARTRATRSRNERQARSRFFRHLLGRTFSGDLVQHGVRGASASSVPEPGRVLQPFSSFPQPFSQMLRSLPSRCNAEAIASSNRAPLHTTVRTGSVHGGSRSCVVTPRQACGIGNTDRSRFWVREEHHSISGQTLFPKSHPMIQTSIEAAETETRN